MSKTKNNNITSKNINQLEFNFTKHQIDNQLVFQRNVDGYINATAMCKAASKRWNNYIRLPETQSFIKELSDVTRISATALICTIQGGNPQQQGTWIHPKVAINLGQWLSPKFAVKVSEWVLDWTSKETDKKAGMCRQFHDRISSSSSAPVGYFSIFKEISEMILDLGLADLHIDSSFVPDISVGLCYAKYWSVNNLDEKFGTRVRFEHNYPSCYAQSLSNPQEVWCYPEDALGNFRRWIRKEYIEAGRFKNYLFDKMKKDNWKYLLRIMHFQHMKIKRCQDNKLM